MADTQRGGITLTGAYERTPLDDLVRLADLGAEVALLYTFDREGRNRYPRQAWVKEALVALEDNETPGALHVCGKRAREHLLRGHLDHLLCCVDRFQVNGEVEPDVLAGLCADYPFDTVITQHRQENTDLLSVGVVNHALLVDASGGRGLLPEQWVRPETPKAVGFAGGLGPENLAEQLPKIAAVARGDWWIDLESSLRDGEDWFSVEKALEVMHVFRSWKEQNPCATSS